MCSSKEAVNLSDLKPKLICIRSEINDRFCLKLEKQLGDEECMKGSSRVRAIEGQSGPRGLTRELAQPMRISATSQLHILCSVD